MIKGLIILSAFATIGGGQPAYAVTDSSPDQMQATDATPAPTPSTDTPTKHAFPPAYQQALPQVRIPSKAGQEQVHMDVPKILPPSRAADIINLVPPDSIRGKKIIIYNCLDFDDAEYPENVIKYFNSNISQRLKAYKVDSLILNFRQSMIGSRTAYPNYSDNKATMIPIGGFINENLGR